MRIASSDISFSSQHTLVEEHRRREELVAGVSAGGGVWDPDRLQGGTVRTREQPINSTQLAPQAANTRPTLLDEYLDGRSLDAIGRLADEAGQTTHLEELARKVINGKLIDGTSHAKGEQLDPIESVIPIEIEVAPKDRLKMQLIQAAVEAFSGRPFHVFSPADLNFGKAPDGVPVPTAAAAAEQAPEDNAEEPTFGVLYRVEETHYEREVTTFHAEGVVRTADGEQINIDISLTMGRQFYSEESLEVRAGGALQDPLVVNFAGTAAELTERTYAFDLDTDGEAEQIHFVGPNSGFLALDHDNSGTIDDGSELFGARTGNGFGELAAHDEDGNQFIDEADSVYEKLRIWQKDHAGNDQLIALGDSGVGALYLGHLDTPFQVKDEANQLQGVVRSSGIYLKEGGGTGTVQQLDLVG